jgi:hypothetical protein
LLRRALVVLAVALLTSGACSDQRDTGLQVKGYAADLVFGAVKRQPVAPVGDSGAMPPPGDVSLPPSVIDPRLRGGPTISRATACPKAPLGAAAAEPAPVAVAATSRPEIGASRWKRTGTVTVPTGLKLDVTGFEQRVVRDVTDATDGFAYQTVKPDVAGPLTYVTTWQVKPEAFQQNVSELNVSVTAGDFERGLTIKAIDTFDATGTLTGSFRPITGLLVLPLPVVPGERFASVAIDADTLQVAQYQGQVVKRDRIDACGEFIEGWQVVGTLTFVGEQPQQYDLLVATQRGATVIAEHVVGQSLLGAFDLTFSLGQVHPA